MDASLIATNSRAQSAYTDAMQSRASSKVAGAQTPDKVRGAAQQFEAFFVGQMMELMTAGIKADGNTGGGQAENTWRSMLNQEYGKQIAKSGGLGIADSVMKSMLQMQEQRTAAAAKLGGDPQVQASPGTADTGTVSSDSQTIQAAIAAGSVARAKQTAM